MTYIDVTHLHAVLELGGLVLVQVVVPLLEGELVHSCGKHAAAHRSDCNDVGHT